MAIEKFCTRCGKKFIATGREVICPACKQAAAEESKKAAVLRAKKASWNGESVPVRISGRASTLIREYGAENSLPFAQALDALLQSTACFKGMQMAWEDITPYKSRRRDKHTTENTSTTENKQDAQEVKQASKASASKATSKTQAAGKAASKTSTAGKAGKKA